MLTIEQREALEWAADRAHVASLGKPIEGAERRRWRVLLGMLAAHPTEQAGADAEDAERMRALCAEMDVNRCGVRYDGMQIWDAMCNAVGDDKDGDGLRAAIDAARTGGKA